ncbi:hypothetical protein M9H77_13622 [Catharanthus roseus]|uniref:Uncharacterized protein n=1 Tax=Catharanthus roseus TaxID=4058 RepID=A0ACC0BKY5_CATRO|nr:hypothetical protein M9H77_13622 [Catharanthus roseus]
MGAAQKGDKGVLKWITSTLVDKGSKKTTGKDKGKMPMGKNDEKGLEKRKAKAEAAKSELKQKQEELRDNPHDEQLKEMVKELQHKARFLVDVERRFYAKKTKCKFLLEEVISSIIRGIESFWLGVLPISAVVLDRITGMCRRFLWGSNSAQVAWHTMCLSKQEGELGLRDTRRWNDNYSPKPFATFMPRKILYGASGFIIST